RVAGLTAGVLGIVTDTASGVQPPTSYSVLRLTRELSTRSRVGILAVDRRAVRGVADQHATYGFDGRLGVGDAWTLDWWGAKTETPGRRRDDLGYSARIAYQTGVWNNNARIVQVGSEFNPAVGFLNRTGGYRFYEATAMRLVRKAEWAWLKQWNPHVGYMGYYDPDGF